MILLTPDYNTLEKAFKLAVIDCLTFTQFIFGDDELLRAMKRYLIKAKEKDEKNV